MSSAAFQVVFAGPLVSYQDSGRFGHMRYGVTPAGPMDKRSHATANRALGNDQSNTCIEVSAGGLILKCVSGSVTFSVVGGEFQIECFEKYSSGIVATVDEGQTLSIRPGQSGSWCYLAFAGTVTAPSWLGHTATHALSGLGGGLLGTGQTVLVEDCAVASARVGDIKPFSAHDKNLICRVVIGPQDQHFSVSAMQQFLNAEFILSNAYDRMGVRLDGPELAPEGSLSIPSEPVVKGSIQISGDGVPTVLLADHQPTGGYPKIATVAPVDFDRFVQLRSGDSVRFKAIKPEVALQQWREFAAQLGVYLDEISQPKGTLDDRLRSVNLISGVVGASDPEP